MGGVGLEKRRRRVFISPNPFLLSSPRPHRLDPPRPPSPSWRGAGFEVLKIPPPPLPPLISPRHPARAGAAAKELGKRREGGGEGARIRGWGGAKASIPALKFSSFWMAHTQKRGGKGEQSVPFSTFLGSSLEGDKEENKERFFWNDNLEASTLHFHTSNFVQHIRSVVEVHK